MAGPVLVLTHRDDLTADMVIHELNRREVPVIRVDPADFPSRMRLTASTEFDGWIGQLATEGGRSVRLGEVRAIYYRRPGLPRFPVGMSPAEREWSTREAVHGVLGTLASLGCLYVNHPASVYAADFKPTQLAAAVHAGLPVPPTLITNEPDEARIFIERHGRCVWKPLRGGSVIEDGQAVAAHTVVVDSDMIDDSVAGTAHLFQKYINGECEVRLTVVGTQMFAAEIRAHSDQAKIDYRTDYDHLTYRVTDVPDQVRDQVLALMHRCDLVFASMDFVVSRGEWIFLGDLNPNGQWGWIEAHLPELQISSALAGLLSGERG